jgi:hypothetical protein
MAGGRGEEKGKERERGAKTGEENSRGEAELGRAFELVRIALHVTATARSGRPQRDPAGTIIVHVGDCTLGPRLLQRVIETPLA